MTSQAFLQVRNPHSVLAALQTRPRDVIQIVVPNGVQASDSSAWSKVVSLASSKGVKVSTGMRESTAGPKVRNPGGRAKFEDAGGRVGVAEAQIKPREGVSAEELFQGSKDRADGKGLWIALDSLTDPHNVGAIFRAASFFGAQGILLTQERSAPLSAAVYDVACGGIEHVPFTLQTNLQRAFEIAKDAGLWILGTSEHAKQSFRQIERDRPWLLVLGNEEKGMRRLTEESCDVVCQVPPQGGEGCVTSLNVSVAAGVLISKLTS